MKRSFLGIASLLALSLAISLTFWACGGDNNSSVTGPETALQISSAPEHAKAVGVHNRHIPDILSREGVVGTAISSDDRGKPTFTIYTERALPAGRLPASLDGYRVIQQVTGPIRAYKGGPPPMGGNGGDDPKNPQSAPVKMGTSGGWRYDLANGFCCAGTLGSLVERGGSTYILSNYHVLYADIVNGGNGRVASDGDPVIQPGLIDVNCNAGGSLNIGTLINGGGTLPDAGNPDAVDAGIALVTPGQVDESGAILNVGVIAAGGGVAASNGMAVKKMGRTTGLTRSSVSATNGAFNITYSNECAGGTSFTQSYQGQIVIANKRCKFQDGGDSGSLLLEDVETAPNAVGLCFAGSSQCGGSAIAIANPIGDVLSKLGGGASMVGVAP